MHRLIFLFLKSTTISHILQKGNWGTNDTVNPKSHGKYAVRRVIKFRPPGSQSCSLILLLYWVSMVNAKMWARATNVPGITFERFLLKKSSIYSTKFSQVKNRYEISQASVSLKWCDNRYYNKSLCVLYMSRDHNKK